MESLKKFSLYVAFAGNMGVIIAFWWSVSHGLLGGDLSAVFLALGRLAGLLAVCFALLQFLLMGRAMWIEKLFGLDKLARVHKLNGYLTISFILLHPILLLVSYAGGNGVGPVEQLLDFLTNYPDVWQSAIAVVLFGTIVFLSISIVRRKLKYELWYFIHLLTYLAVLLAFGHQLKIGGDLLGNKFFASYWWALYIFVFGNVAIFRFARPVYKTLKHGFKVDELVAETADTTSVYISGKNLQAFKVRPGQFLSLRFLAKGFWWQSHPFSLSYVPKNDRLRVTIKNSGDFTAKIPTLKKGTSVFIDGPYGIFTAKKDPNAKYLFIAGGVGITPIRSLIEQLSPTNDIILLYSNKTVKDIIFKNELEELTKNHRFPLHHILTDQPDYEGEKGRLDKEKLQRLVKDLQEREIYICGPIPMTDAIRKLLMELGVERHRIHFEKFAL